jgi:hypothetical protein
VVFDVPVLPAVPIGAMLPPGWGNCTKHSVSDIQHLEDPATDPLLVVSADGSEGPDTLEDGHAAGSARTLLAGAGRLRTRHAP